MLKVLIADDEPRVGQLVKHLIHWDELGLSFVDICRDGRTALERIEQEQPEIVITDIRMPVLTGLELVQQVTERFPQTRFVVISGYRYFEYAQKALKYGVEDYLLKPIDEEELNRTLKKICDALQTTAVHRAQMEKYEKNYENSQKLLSRDVNGAPEGGGRLCRAAGIQCGCRGGIYRGLLYGGGFARKLQSFAAGIGRGRTTGHRKSAGEHQEIPWRADVYQLH
jgi:putative two-component response regulator